MKQQVLSTPKWADAIKDWVTNSSEVKKTYEWAAMGRGEQKNEMRSLPYGTIRIQLRGDATLIQTCCHLLFWLPWLNEAPSKGSVVKKQRTAWLISGFCLAIYNGFFKSSVFQSFYLFRFRTRWPKPVYKLVRLDAIQIRRDLVKYNFADGCLHSISLNLLIYSILNIKFKNKCMINARCVHCNLPANASEAMPWSYLFFLMDYLLPCLS